MTWCPALTIVCLTFSRTWPNPRSCTSNFARLRPRLPPLLSLLLHRRPQRLHRCLPLPPHCPQGCSPRTMQPPDRAALGRQLCLAAERKSRHTANPPCKPLHLVNLGSRATVQVRGNAVWPCKRPRDGVFVVMLCRRGCGGTAGYGGDSQSEGVFVAVRAWRRCMLTAFPLASRTTQA